MGVGRCDGLRAFQSPFLLTSDALLDRATGDPRVTRPLLSSMKWVKVTGLAVLPAGVRYLFAPTGRSTTPQAFAGTRIRINESLTTEDLLRSLGARPTTAVRHGRDVIEALESGRLDAVEADIRTAGGNGYIGAAPYISSPIFAKVTTLVANSERLRALGPEAAEWIRDAAERTAAVQRAGDDSTSWAAACGAGLKHAPSTPAQLDALQRAALDVHAGLDGDNPAALAIDRMGLHAVRERADDPWAQCGRRAQMPSPTKVIDGAYEHTVSKAAEVRAGSAEGNAGPYRVEFGHGRYAVLRPGSAADPASPGWDFDHDPVEVGSVVLRGDVATMRPETSILFGSTPKIYRFELFRDRLRWRYVRGVEDFLMTAGAWRKVG